jgi:serpin B
MSYGIAAAALSPGQTAASTKVSDGSTSDADDKNLGIVGGVAPKKKKKTVASHKAAKSGTTGGGDHAVAPAVAPAATTAVTPASHSTSTSTSSPPGGAENSGGEGNAGNAENTVSRPAESSAGTSQDSMKMPDTSSSSTSVEGSKKDDTNDKPAVSLVAGENFFGISTYKSLASSASKNFFISPISLHSCLHMLFDGAGGETASEMAKVLGFPKDSAEEENQQYVDLMAILHPPDEENPYFFFSSANSLWANKNIQLKSAFAESSKKVFQAQVESLDFSQPESLSKINKWVSDQTRGKIPTILNQLNPDQTLVAVNAAYFKARWKKVFEKAKTKEADFNTAGGAVKVPLMDITGDYNYYENDSFQSIEVPYEGEKTSLVVLLPRETTDLAHLRESLSADKWKEWTDKMSLQSGQLYLPRFKMGYEVYCKNVLKEAGMKRAFEPQADFSGIIEGKASAGLSDVVHKTFVKVDEEGTEAAAATASVEKMLTMMVDKGPVPFKMIVNRPFLFAVVNWKTRAILFIGQCVNPTEG